MSEGLTHLILNSLCPRCAEVAGELRAALEALASKKNSSGSQTWKAATRSI